MLGIKPLHETLRIWGPTLVLLGCGLTTAAIVGALTGTSATNREDDSFSIVDDSSYLCVGLASSTPAAYYWDLPNGSQYQVQPDMQFCPAAEALTLVGGINVDNPAPFGYADNGVAVGHTALGAPAAIYSSESAWNEGASYNLALVDPLQQYGTSLLSASRCAPVMNSNPGQCQTAAVNYAGGILTAKSSTSCSLSASDSGKNSYSALCTHSSVGEATIIIAAIYPSAVFLAESIGDAVWLQAYDNNQSASVLPYAIECAVEAALVFQYGDVALSLQNSSASADIGTYSRSLNAADLGPCVPDGMTDGEDSLKTKLPAIAATAAFQPLFYDWVGTTRQLTISPGNIYGGSHTIFIRPPPFAFSNSRNAMEDVLGLVSALVVSRVSVTGGSNSQEYRGSAQALYTRIETGNPWALLYVFPPLIAAGALFYLWIVTGGIRVEKTSNRLTCLARYFGPEDRRRGKAGLPGL